MGSTRSNDVVTGDFDGDGATDVYLVTPIGDQAYRNVDGELDLVDDQIGVSDGRRGTAADFDGDGLVDVAVATAGANRIHLGDGAGGFRVAEAHLGAGTSHSVASADVDGDDALDLVFANEHANTLWLNRSRGPGSEGE